MDILDLREEGFQLIETWADCDGIQFNAIAGGEDDQLTQVAPGWVIPAAYPSKRGIQAVGSKGELFAQHDTRGIMV